MLIKEHILSALSALINNKLRSGLSMLGIIIGVFSIIVMMALGEGTKNSVVDRFNSMGANLITISPGSSNSYDVRGGGSSNKNLIDDEFVSFVKDIQGVKNVSPIISSSRQFIYGTYNTNSSIIGVTPIYLSIKNLSVADGSFVTQDDVDNMSNVAVIGYELAKNAFPSGDGVGKEIKLENSIFTVIGVLSDNSQSNNRVYIPLSTGMSKIVGTHYYGSMDVQVENSDNVDTMKTLIEQELLKYTGKTSSDDAEFTVSSMSEILSTVQEVTGTMTMFLSGIAAISLIVGGIGVMNIMLVSVTERTREIGIRKAIGARKDDILAQFLIEALIISILAGMIGIGLSFGAVKLLNNFMKADITTNSIMISFFSVVIIGIVFGILPASKASKLKPIDALRFE